MSRHENVDHQCHVTKFRCGEAVHAGPSLEPLRLDSGPNLHDAAERQLFIVKLTFVEAVIYMCTNRIPILSPCHPLPNDSVCHKYGLSDLSWSIYGRGRQICRHGGNSRYRELPNFDKPRKFTERVFINSVYSELTWARQYPSFEDHDPLLLKAGKATACVIVEVRNADGSSGRNFGTAFFITRTHLLTAGHVVQSSPGTRIESIRLSYAGCKTVDYDTNTVECKLIGKLYDSASPDSSKIDLALLESPSQDAGTWLPISPKITDLPIGAVVDIVGYPGHMTRKQKECFEKKASLNDPNQSMKEAELMLPPKTLTVSRGVVEGIENGFIRYRLSSLCGMSGGCLIYDGTVYGFSMDVNAHRRGACGCMRRGKWIEESGCFTWDSGSP